MVHVELTMIAQKPNKLAEKSNSIIKTKKTSVKTVVRVKRPKKPKVVKPLTAKQILGQKGEEYAALFLVEHGYTVISRNYRQKWGEIDIVAQKGNDLRFVEVKTVTRRTTDSKEGMLHVDHYEPEDNIHPWKLKRLSRAIETYLLDKDVSDKIDWQLDVISVYVNWKGELGSIEWLEGVF